MSAFHKISSEPKDDTGYIELNDGSFVLDHTGERVVVTYQEYRKLAATPDKLIAFAKKKSAAPKNQESSTDPADQKSEGEGKS